MVPGVLEKRHVAAGQVAGPDLAGDDRAGGQVALDLHHHLLFLGVGQGGRLPFQPPVQALDGLGELHPRLQVAGADVVDVAPRPGAGAVVIADGGQVGGHPAVDGDLSLKGVPIPIGTHDAG